MIRGMTLSRALMLTVLVALLPLLLASFFQASASWRDTRALASAQLNATSRAVAERTRDSFIIARHTLNTVATLPEVVNFTEGCTAGLAAGRTNDGTLNNLVRADATGAVRCSIIPFQPGTNLKSDAWWRTGIARGGLSVTQPVVGRVAKKPVIIVMLALQNADGSSNGSVSAGVEIASIQRNIAEDPAGRLGYVAVLDKEGRAFAASRQVPFNPIAVNMLQGTVDATDGKTWSYSLTPILNRDLFVMYAEPQKEIMSVALSNIRYSVLIPLLAILFACGAIWIGTNFFVLRWLRRLQLQTSQFARGNFSAAPEPFDAAPREVQEAERDLRHMASAIVARNADLNASLDAQTKLTREIHHRVKNNLQIVTSLLTLQAGRLKDPGARAALGQTRARVSALGLIYRLLYEEGSNAEKGEVALELLIRELCGQLRSSRHDRPDIDLKCTSEAHAISIDQAVPLTLLAVEAVTNAFSHAFPDNGGCIQLSLFSEDSLMNLTVEDDGIGYDREAVSGQMGTDLMQAFAVQLNGQLTSQHRTGGGTIVSLAFKSNVEDTA